ncbi:MAG: serine/threonine protein kinase [Candidatus Obscuribacterales bacterium]|nr:serine/threonine protein kinase [Candidatus Obscuribacterales bacterium]
MPESPTIAKLKPGQYFQGKYEILEHVGDGGFGAVYKARHMELGLIVAIKVLHPEMLTHEENRTRFQTEGKILAELSHPNVVHSYENGISATHLPFIVMEFLQGETLNTILNEGRRLTPAEAINIGIQVCDALSAAHACGIVHRDLKPNNIVLLTKRDGLVKLLDFGLSRIMESSKVLENQHLTQTGFLIGSVRYMSPEQCVGDKADHRSDIYALGCILYECISGELPLSAENPVGMLHKHAHEAPMALSEVAAGVSIPEGLETVLLNALIKHPDCRYQTAAAMKADLELVRKAKGHKVKQLLETPGALAERAAFDRKANIAVIVLAILAIVTLLYPCLKPALDSLKQTASHPAQK